MAESTQALSSKGISPSLVRTVSPGYIGELRVDKAPFGFRLTHPARFHPGVHTWLKGVGARWNHDCWEIAGSLEVGLAQRLRRYERDCEKSGRTFARLAQALEKEAAQPLGFKGDGYHVTLRGDTYYVSFPFHPRLVAEIKKIPGKRYVEKEWRVPVTAYDDFAPFVQRMRETCERKAKRNSADLEGLAKELQESLVSDQAGVKVTLDGQRYKIVLADLEGEPLSLSHVPGAFFNEEDGAWYAPSGSYESLSAALLRIRSLMAAVRPAATPVQSELL